MFRVQEDVKVVLVPFESLGQTKLGCPLFVRGQQVVAVPAIRMICDVSFIHRCGSGCKVQVSSSTRRVERETVQLDSGVTFTHDSDNEVFYYNVFCLNN